MSAMYGQSPQPTPSSPTGSTEKSIKSCYAVVYELQNRKWAVSGEGGWSEVHLCHDSSDNSHRILAWTVKHQNVLMNCNVTAECSYKEKSKNFHSFTDENKNRFGLGFHKSDSGLRQAMHFLNATQGVIKECKNMNNDLQGFSLGNGGGYGGGGGPPPNPYQSHKGSYASHQNKPLPPSPNHSSQNNYSNNSNNNYSNNNSQASSGGGMPKPPPFMSSASKENNTTNNNNNNRNSNVYKPKSPSVPSHNSNNNNNSNGNGKPAAPPPNPYSPQYKSQVAQPQAQGKGNAQPPPAFSSYSQQQQAQQSQQPRQPPQQPSPRQQGKAQPPQPPPSMSQAQGNSNGSNYPQLQKPQSPYQSTTESVKLSPVQAAVNHENEQKQQQKPQGYGYGQQGPKSPIAEANLPNYHLNNKQTKSLPSQPIGALGSLKILPPKPSKLRSGDKKILNPDAVEHTVRVVHDKDTGEFHGLPKEWMEALNKQFGVKPHMLPSVKLEQYAHKIPKVLITLRKKLEDANAYEQVGIFRLAPNATASDQMKATIDKGKFDSSEEVDPNVYANLIKVWFRDMPDPLLNCVDPTMIEMAQKENDVAQVVSKFPEPQKSIFEWLCDMCVACAKFEKTNKMGPQNLAIVIGPNLFNTDNFENPMKAMTFSGKVVQFFKVAIVNRQKQLQS